MGSTSRHGMRWVCWRRRRYDCTHVTLDVPTTVSSRPPWLRSSRGCRPPSSPCDTARSFPSAWTTRGLGGSPPPAPHPPSSSDGCNNIFRNIPLRTGSRPRPKRRSGPSCTRTTSRSQCSSSSRKLRRGSS